MPSRILIVGDTQRVLPIERLAFLRETNDAGRVAIGAAILAELGDCIVHLGDLLGAVGSQRDWARFDGIYSPAVLAQKRFLVCRGNHDCGGFWMGNPRVFNDRYPETLGVLRVHELKFARLILLDTNAAAMSPAAWQMQREEFAAELQSAEGDPSVHNVFVFGHHPPFTNGRWHAPAQAVHDAFVPKFLKCTKTRAFFSGHVHGYERFVVEGRHFVVTAGGGGPRFVHLHGAKQRQRAALDLSDPHPLNYVSLEIDGAGFRAVAHGLAGTNELTTIDSFAST